MKKRLNRKTTTDIKISTPQEEEGDRAETKGIVYWMYKSWIKIDIQMSFLPDCAYWELESFLFQDEQLFQQSEDWKRDINVNFNNWWINLMLWK